MKFPGLDTISQHIIHYYEKEQQPILVALAGGSSLGKTSHLIPLLRHQLEQYYPVTIIHQDQFRDISVPQTQYHPIYQGDDPQLYQLPICSEVVKSLKSGKDVQSPGWKVDWNPLTNQKILFPVQHHYTPAPIILLEGFYALHPLILHYSDIGIYIEGPAWSRLIRRIIRNWIERKYGDPHNICHYFLHSVLPAHRAFVTRQKLYANYQLKSPYRFDDSIHKFGLTAKQHMQNTHHSVYTFNMDDDTSFHLFDNKEGRLTFQCIHKKGVYVSFDVNFALAQKIMDEDWTAY